MERKQTLYLNNFYCIDIMFSNFCGFSLKLPSSTSFFGFTFQAGVPHWTQAQVIECSISIPIIFLALSSVLTVLLRSFRRAAICDRNE